MNLLDKSRILVTILGFVIFVPLISCQQSTYTCKPTGTNFNCSCVFNAQSNGTYVNCKAEGLTSFPLSFDDIQDEPIVLLELANNSIRTIGETDLNNYEYLETLVLDNCQLTSDTNTYAFYDNAALVTVILANNPELKKVPLPPVSIQELDLSNCGLNDTGSDVLDLKNLEDAPYLFELTLDNNGLSEWPINIPPKLGVLKLRDNYLTTIMTDIGSSLTRLEYLHLDNNKITTLDSNTPSMPDSLHELSLDSNPIYTLNNDYFHNMNFIEDLSVSFTNINFISSIVFQGMFPMYSGHRIRISFQHNAYLEEISKEVFDPFLYSVNKYSLLEIELDGNPLNCVCEMVWIPRLLINQQNYGLSPDNVTISGTCVKPAALYEVKLSDLKETDITCEYPTESPPDNGSSAGRSAAIVLGLILSLVVVASLVYFVYNRYFKNTYLSV